MHDTAKIIFTSNGKDVGEVDYACYGEPKYVLNDFWMAIDSAKELNPQEKYNPDGLMKYIKNRSGNRKINPRLIRSCRKNNNYRISYSNEKKAIRVAINDGKEFHYIRKY